MRIMKTGEPCPCCGQAIPAMLPVDKRLLASVVAEGLAIQDAVRTVEHGGVESQEAPPTLTPPNEWVSVEDTVPDPGDRVLATDGIFVGEAYRTSADSWFRHTGFPWRDGVTGGTVKFWMPLPASPDRRPPEGKT